MTRLLAVLALWAVVALAALWGLECHRLARHPAALRAYLAAVLGVGVTLQGVLVLLFDREERE